MTAHHMFIVGNWKMNPSSFSKAQELFTTIDAGVPKQKNLRVIICPSYPHIAPLAADPKRKVHIGAQDAFFEQKGSFTGQVSFDVLADLGVSYVILGHSERRKLGETDEIINKKILLALKSKITPILCVGEDVRDEEGKYLAEIKTQLENALQGVSKRELDRLIIAYEPVWAVGGAVAMNARDVHEMTIFVRKTLVDIYKMKTPPNTPILYGGAVDPSNAEAILRDGKPDGLLIGRQSLETQNFLNIISSAASCV